LTVERETPLRPHPAGDGKGYTLTSTMLTGKLIQPHFHKMLVVEKYIPFEVNARMLECREKVNLIFAF
jgi:hypothetical protein